MRLPALAMRGAYVSVAGQALRFVVQFGSLAVLARILQPDDFGLMAMITAVVGIAAVFGDFGLSLAAVQAKELTESQRTMLFWWNSMIGLLFAIVVFSLAENLAHLYGEPILSQATRALACVYLLGGVTIQFRANLNRSMRFGRLAFNDVGSQVAGVLTAIVCAVAGLGFWALVWQQVAVSVAALVLSAEAARWVPGLPTRAVSMKKFFAFGAATTSTQVLNFVSSNVDSIAIGRLHGADALGIYGRAFQLFMLPLQQLVAPMTRVALPVLVQITEPREFNRYLQKAQLVVSYVLVTTLAAIAGLSAEIVEIVLGAGWSDASDVLRILIIGGVFQSCGSTYYWAFLSRARMRVLLACESAGRLPMIAMIIMVAPYGIRWVGAAVSAGLFLIWATTSMFGLRRTGVEPYELVRVSLRPLLLGAFIYSALTLVQTLVAPSGPSLLLRLGAGIGTLVAVLLVALAVKSYRRDLANVLLVLRVARRT